MSPSKIVCQLCKELLYDPVSLPCGFSICRTCFPRYSFVLPTTLDSDPDSGQIINNDSPLQNQIPLQAFISETPGTFAPDTPANIETQSQTGFQCPVASCSIVHVYRNEKQDIFLKKLIEKSFPVEQECYTILRSIERDLMQLKHLDILFDMNYTTPVTEPLSICIQKYILILSAAISVTPSLCKLRIYRAALYWNSGRYGDALLDVFMVYKINAYSLKSNHFMQTSGQSNPQSNIPICFANNPLVQTSNSLTLEKYLPPSVISTQLISETDLSLADFECPVCLNTLYEPISKPCGHTSCKGCILKTAKINPKCPICRTNLPSISYLAKRTPNMIITSLLTTKFPQEYFSRDLKADPTVERIPIFVCSLAFPGCTYGFHLFEPRYRTLVKRCMSTNRRFGICLPYQSQESNAPEFSDYGTVVEITRCEAFTSGDLEESEEGPLPRYIIETLGKYRFKVESRGIETAGYYFANVTRIDDLDMDDQDSVSYVGQEEKNVQICMFDTIEKEPTIHSLVRSVQAISKGLKAGKSIPAKSPWSPLTLNILIAKLRQFVADLFAGIHPHARIALESQFGSPPEDISDLTYWITQIIPLESSMKYKLLEINILKDRLKIIFTWIENATSWSNVEKDDIQSV